MELGLMGCPPDALTDLVHELGIKHCGVGAAAHDIQSSLEGYEQATRMGLNTFGVVPVEQADVYDGMFFYDFAKKLRSCCRNFPMRTFVIWEEPSLPYVVGDKLKFRDYVTLLRVAYETIKEYDPSIQVWNGGIGQHGGLWTIQEFLSEAIDYTDAVNLHPFHFDSEPKRVVELISGLLSRTTIFMEIIKKVKPIVCTEWGYCSAQEHTTYGSFVDPKGAVPAALEKDQSWIVKEVLELAEPIVPLFCFAILQDMDSPHWGGHTGLLRVDGSEKLALAAVRQWVATQQR